MNIEEKNMINFIEELSCSLSTKAFMGESTSSVENIPLNHKECVYLLDFERNKIIYSKGFKNVLGFSDDEVNLDFILNSHHPEDGEMVNRIRKATLSHCFINPLNVLTNVLFISYRRRKIDGSYIKVLNESRIYEINDKGIPVKGLGKITDISFMDTSNTVNWTFQADHLDKESFKEMIYKESSHFFTEREKDIIKEIEKGATNGLISKYLNISRHTVATHRKNIFKKANLHNVADLILFCKRKGII